MDTLHCILRGRLVDIRNTNSGCLITIYVCLYEMFFQDFFLPLFFSNTHVVHLENSIQEQCSQSALHLDPDSQFDSRPLTFLSLFLVIKCGPI